MVLQITAKTLNFQWGCFYSRVCIKEIVLTLYKQFLSLSIVDFLMYQEYQLNVYVIEPFVVKVENHWTSFVMCYSYIISGNCFHRSVNMVGVHNRIGNWWSSLI